MQVNVMSGEADIHAFFCRTATTITPWIIERFPKYRHVGSGVPVQFRCPLGKPAIAVIVIARVTKLSQCWLVPEANPVPFQIHAAAVLFKVPDPDSPTNCPNSLKDCKSCMDNFVLENSQVQNYRLFLMVFVKVVAKMKASKKFPPFDSNLHIHGQPAWVQLGSL